MLQRNLSESNNRPSAWQELADGAPTIVAFAQLCSTSLLEPDQVLLAEQFTDEAKAILALAAKRGTIEIRAHRDPVDSVERFLSVCVEVEPERRHLFLQKENPQQTVRFLDAFRELCRAGLIVHHLHRDFSLSRQGFEFAKQFDPSDFVDLIGFATELDWSGER
jgi:hypothetical protein